MSKILSRIKKLEQTIKKEDWIRLKENAEMNLKQTYISFQQFITLSDICDKNIKELEKTKHKEIIKELAEDTPKMVK